jgi:DNA repair ATPase RecN
MNSSSSSKKLGDTMKQRTTLVQQAGIVHIRDPEAHTRHQVSELDKSAKSSMMKKKAKLDQIESDAKEIAQIDEQVRQIKLRYDPLCENLIDRQSRKQMMLEKLESSCQEERRIMGDTKVLM